ncbi:MAG: hypothetical protein ABSF45_02610 [Terriglobia bacterium]
MRRINVGLMLTILFVLGSNAHAQTAAAFRVLFGITDTASTRWDGSLKVKQAGQYTLEPWRFEGVDNIDGEIFHLSTHPGSQGGPAVANGFILTATAVGDSSEFSFSTAQGGFSFRASEVPYGKGIYKLGGRVYVDRVPVTARLTDTREEEDYPSLAAGANGDIWLAYVQFHHSPDADQIRANPPEAPHDFKLYAEPTGGDQIWARKYSGGNWGDNIAVTPAGRDCYKTAVAVDGSGRAWVVWSENHGGNFDIFARAVDASGAGEQVQISKEAGADVDAVATTDAGGRVWIAWQGWRNGVAAIYAAHQEGNGFSKPAKVSNSNQNEWDPAIAADKSGRVAVAWDSYRNGNYDVYARTYSGNAWGEEIPVAATARYEAYPSIAYDGTGRLWIAYEEGGRGWGKDFGAYNSSGIALYQGRLIKLRGLEPNGSFVDLDASLDSALVGAPNAHVDRLGSQADSESLDPNLSIAMHRLPDAHIIDSYPRSAHNTLPRLAVDDSGRVWLAFRTPHPVLHTSIGTVWHEYLVSFGGGGWTQPIFLDHTDNLLDNRPALAAVAKGKLLIVNSSDGRRDASPARTANTSSPAAKAPADPYNNDLWSSEVDLGPGTQGIQVVAARPGAPPATTIDRTRTAAIQAIHEHRGGPERNLRIVRGEFHRHSETSSDGGNDGTLFDQWRYILDAAGLDWVGCCDHDNGGGREYTWWITQKLTDIFYTPGKFAPMFSYERSVNYPDGHRNVIFAQRGIHTLPRLNPSRLATAAEENRVEHTPDTQMLYAYLKQFDGIVGSHTSATGMGTDWRDNDPNAEPVVEIYQGLRQDYEMPGAPRANTQEDSIGGWRPKGFINLALDKGYRLGFEASSDHVSTHMSYANVYVKDLSRESVLDALKKRHVYAATDEILADVESGSHMMGDEFSTVDAPTLKIKLRGTSKFAKITIVRDGKFVYSTSPYTQEVEFSWRDNQPQKDKTSYYYVRGEQDDGEIVWVSPMWINYTGN